jgi:hypothetical protein
MKKTNYIIDSVSCFIKTFTYNNYLLPFNNTLLSNLKCLQPDVHGTVESETAFRSLAQALPHVVSGPELSLVTDEWKHYALDDISLVSNLPVHQID